MNGNRIIVHGLIKVDEKYLVIKRSLEENVYQGYWDIPGGMVELGELPKEALIRETKEEVNLDVSVENPIHEDSNLDVEKDKIFIRLVYKANLINNIKDIKLNLEEHTQYKLISSIDELLGENIVPFVEEILTKLK